MGTCYPVPEAAAFEAELSGRDGSWDLPLKEEGIEPIVIRDTDRCRTPTLATRGWGQGLGVRA